ncbi:MAG: Methyltransferase type 12 [Solirubrobacteraceae bacterium]|nr:Methyltransferase type 12 [Solirubrobacteraceae bacterium]
MSAVVWHDVECGSYAEDLPLWRELAAQAGGPVLDVGAGTGRVALDLARAGHEIVALDIEPELLAALRERAGDLPVRTVTGDARAFSLTQRFALVIAPMQTVQLLDGRHEDFVRCAAEHLAPGGIVAAALANPPEYDGEVRPLPDMREQDGWLWSSQPVAVRPAPTGMVIQRTREIVSPDGDRTVADDEILLTRTLPEDLEAAGEACGLRPLPRRVIPETADYVGSEVVVLHG